jgi:arylsulfatase A-like enzyme
MLAPQLLGKNVTGLMHHTDWLPTLLEAANVE